MTQVLFGAATTPLETDLDANFTELYGKSQAIIGAAGQVGINKTPVTGVSLDVAGYGVFGQTGSGFDVLDVMSTNSVNIRLQAQGSGTIGAVGSTSNCPFYIQTNNIERVRTDAGFFRPGVDNALTCGQASFRWSTVYAVTGTISTSDARDKTAVAALTLSEIAASKSLAAAIGTYKWLDAVQKKGSSARVHVGLTVQNAIAIMSANGLDPMAYGFICHDTWTDFKSPEGEVLQPAGDRYSLRPDELLLFLARGFDARLTAGGL